MFKLGRADRPKGIIKTSKCSSKVIPFVQDVLYYNQMGTYYNSKNNLSKALLFLQKAIEIEPENPVNHYNLACLLSKTSRLKEANQIFKHIVQNMDSKLYECYFFIAINNGLMGELDQARHFLLKYLHFSPEGDMADEAEDILLAIEEEDEEIDFADRSLDTLENEALLNLIEEMSKAGFKERLIAEEEFRNALRRGLYQGSDLLKEAILKLLGESHCKAAREYLADFIANPWVKERLRQVALLELKKQDPTGCYRVFAEGAIRAVELHHYPNPAPVWKTEWQQVIDCTFANMSRSACYSDEFYEDAEAIWLDYINQSYPEVPRINKLQTWAAGLEYCLIRFHFLGMTQKELAEIYGVSTASIRRKYTEINRLLQIDQKAYRNMLTFIADNEEEQF